MSDIAPANPGATTTGPLVEVVIAAYQAERYLAQTLASLLTQTHTNWRCHIVDDGSTDGTAEVAQGFAARDRRIHLIQQPNRGEGGARNRGLAALCSESEYVHFLDSDDLLLADGMATLLACLTHRPDAAGASGLAEFIDAEGRPIAPGAHPATQRLRIAYRGLRSRVLAENEDTTWSNLIVLGNIWPPASALVRRRVVDAVGGFDESLKTLADWDYFLRVSRLGPLAFVPTQVAWYRRHAGNSSKSNALYVRNVAYVQRKAWRESSSLGQRSSVLRARMHFLAWVAKRNLALMRVGDSRSLRHLLIGSLWLAFVIGSVLTIVPTVPPLWLVQRLVDCDRMIRGRAFLNEYP